MAQHGPTLPDETAWALIILHSAPDETALLRAWSLENPGNPPGIRYDHWHKLSKAEQQRRRRWLQRHGHSPIQLLRLDASLIHSAGIHVLGWGRPPSPAEQHSTMRFSRSRIKHQS
ncbi:hypothetical protein ACPF8X_01635 [Streptomyces sp. G35A]